MPPARILVVEDDPLIAAQVETILPAIGYEVCGVAASEDWALALAARHRPDLALIDIRLSPGDGRRVARELNRRYGTIVLFATGNCDDLHEELAVGALTACLLKPYSVHILDRALDVARGIAVGQPPVGRPPDGLIFLGTNGRSDRAADDGDQPRAAAS